MPTALMSHREHEWLKEGKKEGRAEGREEGREEGARDATLREARSAVMEALDAKFDRAADTVARIYQGIERRGAAAALHRRAVTASSLDDFCKQLPG